MDTVRRAAFETNQTQSRLYNKFFIIDNKEYFNNRRRPGVRALDDGDGSERAAGRAHRTAVPVVRQEGLSVGQGELAWSQIKSDQPPISF